MITLPAASSAPTLPPVIPFDGTENGHSPVALVYPLHGAFAVPDSERGYTVVDIQHGFVTAIDPTGRP